MPGDPSFARSGRWACAPGEPSLETAIFSPTEISWTVPASERARAADRLRELEARANRALSEISRRR